MAEPTSIALVAIGGYGNFYASALLEHAEARDCRIVGVVDPFAQRSLRLPELQQLDVPVFPDLTAFYAERRADLVTIASPIQLHSPQTCKALANGSSVLCEKPACATVQELRSMVEARDRAQRFVAIGYQWSFSTAVQQLKADFLSGRLGEPRRLKTLVLWPRNDAYYGRNSWAGALQDGAGNWVLDSPVNNATAHYLHNMLYVIGERIDRSATPVQVVAELYRANAITNYDTAAARAFTGAGVELLYYASHAVRETRGPEFVFEFTDAVVRLSSGSPDIVAEFTDGTRTNYGNPSDNMRNKLWDAVAAVRGGKCIVCPPEAAGSQTLFMNGMQESVNGITEFPQDLIHAHGEPGKRFTYVSGLDDLLSACYEDGRLPSELDAPWAAPGQNVDLTGYTHFPQP